MPSERDSLHSSCRAVWVCKRCGNCAGHCKHNDPANFHEDLDLPCSGPCQCIDCVPVPCVAAPEVFTVKPLEWEWNGTWFIASTPLFNYVVGNRLTLYNKLQDELKSQPCASPEEGKQLAEAHWQDYLRSALIPVEEPK